MLFPPCTRVECVTLTREVFGPWGTGTCCSVSGEISKSYECTYCSVNMRLIKSVYILEGVQNSANTVLRKRFAVDENTTSFSSTSMFNVPVQNSSSPRNSYLIKN